MIGRRCKARERLSRAPLIGRALRDHLHVPSAPDRSQGHFFLKRCAAPRAPCERHPAHQQPAPQRPPGAGGHGGRGTPGPIPNPEVKPASAEGTAGATLWETRAPPAPGARCAGSGRGGANMSDWERGTREGPPFSFAGLSCLSRGRKAAGMLFPGRPAAFFAFKRKPPLPRGTRWGLPPVVFCQVELSKKGTGIAWGAHAKCATFLSCVLSSRTEQKEHWELSRVRTRRAHRF